MATVNARFLTVQDVADILAVSVWTVRRLIHNGDLKHYRLTAGVIRVRRADLDRFLDKSARQPTVGGR
jgi:excisionase family DNA binding protein